MKKIKTKAIILLLGIVSLSSCSGALDEKLYSQLGESYLTSSPDAIKKVLDSAYGEADDRNNWYFYAPELTSGTVWNEYGSIEKDLTPLRIFTFTSVHPYFKNYWALEYSAIRDANIVIAHTESSTDDTYRQYNAEAKFIRALAYSRLHDWFGQVPLYLSPDDDLYQPKATSDEVVAQIEKDFLAAAEVLPVKQSTYGRATKGAALGLLSYVYLNDKQWQKAADASKQVIDLGVYALYPNFKDLFLVANEGNSELIWVNQANTSASVPYPANILPTDYPHLPTQTIYASHLHVYDWFVDSFDDNDTRKDIFIKSYTNTSNEFIQLYGNDKTLPMKYELNADAIGENYGFDVPVQRYADILLIRAEALNELNGPSDEATALLNQIRQRAHVSTYSTSQFTQSTFRDAIFAERFKEFFLEQKARTDQIRQGTFITKARERGYDAKDYQTVYPIPQSELDANPNLKQNEGY